MNTDYGDYQNVCIIDIVMRWKNCNRVTVLQRYFNGW